MPEPLTDPEMINRKWVFRRKIAFRALYMGVSLISLFLLYVILLAPSVEMAKTVAQVVTWGVVGLFSLTGAYMGLATWAEKFPSLK